MASTALSGVVAYVACDQVEQRLALVSRLRGLGAQIAPRMGREVSHIIFPRLAGLTAEQKTLEDGELRTLFDKARKVRRGGRGAVRRRSSAAPNVARAAARFVRRACV